MEADTGFDPTARGFHFRNSFSGTDVIDELADTGRLDELVGLDLPIGLEGVLGRIRDAGFWGAFGLCGGMTWTALDLSNESRLPPSEATIPGRDSALFKTLVSRQADSMQRGRLMSRCLRYQMIPEVSSFWRPWGRSLGEITEKLEWPKVRASLDSGRPVPICLVRVRGLSNPDKHHQVLATRYSVNAKDILTIGFYDPNRPGAYPAITARLGTRGHDLQPIQTTGEPLHGFFVTDYEPA